MTAATPRFAVTPDHDQLEAIGRDIRFFPSNVSQPRVLSPDDVEQYNREGYVTGITIFDDQEMVEHRRYFDELLKRVIAAGGNSYSISTAHLSYGRVWDILTNQKIVDCVADLLGDDVVGWGAHYFCKMPRDGKSVAWHQDCSYWPLTPTKAVTVWLAIDDADRDNACMQFLPRSHKEGLIGWRPSSGDEGNVLNQTVEDVERFGQPVDVILKAGQVSIHSDLLLHGSQANHSDRRRCGLTLRYTTADARAHLDWNQKGVIVRGADPSGHWANAPRPEED